MTNAVNRITNFITGASVDGQPQTTKWFSKMLRSVGFSLIAN